MTLKVTNLFVLLFKIWIISMLKISDCKSSESIVFVFLLHLPKCLKTVQKMIKSTSSSSIRTKPRRMLDELLNGKRSFYCQLQKTGSN